MGCAGHVVMTQEVTTNTLLLFMNFLNLQREMHAECVLLGEDGGGNHPCKQALLTWDLEQAVLLETYSNPGVHTVLGQFILM
jgi:hypothetical protein